jgi:class 3 adenylate cyclase
VSLARGKLDAARGSAELAIAVHERLGYRKMVWRCRVLLAEALTELGRYEEASAVLPSTSERTELQDIVYDAAAQIRSRLARGRTDEALELAGEIRDRSEELAVHRHPMAVAVEAFVAGGDVESAEVVLSKARAHPGDAGSSFLDEMQGRVHLARGDTTGAAEALGAAIDTSRDQGYPLVELRAMTLFAEAHYGEGDRQGATAELTAVVERAEQHRARLIADGARATAERLAIEVPEVEPGPDARPTEPEIVPAGERLVTSLFADVRGYTDLTGAEAPADVAERMATLYRFARSAVERRGGIVDKFAGDAVMATFNVSGRSVDHVADALDAALTLRDKAALMDLNLGIGIATGAAILGRGASDDNLAVTGMATNLAARLQAAAGPGEILLSAEAHRRVRDRLRERGVDPEREELTLKGFPEPQAGYRLPAPEVRTAEREDPDPVKA